MILNRATFTLAVIAAAVIAAHLLAPDRPSYLVNAFIHALHGPGFAAVAAALWLLIGPLDPPKWRYIIAAVGAGCIGVLAELAQIPGPRDAQLIDLLVDAVGIVAALAAIAVFDRQLRLIVPQRIFLVLFACVMGALTFLPPAWYAYAARAQAAAMPSLLSFEHLWEGSIYWQTDKRHPSLVAAPANWPQSGTVAYTREDGSWGALIRLYPLPDWSAWMGISFIAASTTEKEYRVYVSVRDTPADDEAANVLGYNVMVGPEPQRYVVPFAQMRQRRGDTDFDLRHVETLVFSASQPGSGTSILVDDIRLVD